MDLNRVKPWLTMIAVIIGALTVGFLWASFRLVKIQAVGPNGQPTHTLDVLSLQIGVLTIVVAFVGIGLAILGVFGYQSIKAAAMATAKEAAERQAEIHAVRTATDLLAGLTAQQGVPQQTGPSGNPESEAPTSGEGVVVEREA